jgi:membrane-associated HD superfamily phosphohydrolase
VNNDRIMTEWQPASPECSVLKIQEKLEWTDLPSVVRPVNMSCMRTAYQDVGRVVFEPYSSLPNFILKSLKNSPTLSLSLFFFKKESAHVLSNLKRFTYRIREFEKREMFYYIVVRFWCCFLSRVEEKVIEFSASICCSSSTICWLLGRRSVIFTKQFHAAELFVTLILLTCRIWWALNNASKWQMGSNSAFKGLNW